MIIFPLKLGSFIVDVGCSVQTQTNFLQWCRGVDLASSMNAVVNVSCTIHSPSSLGHTKVEVPKTDQLRDFPLRLEVYKLREIFP